MKFTETTKRALAYRREKRKLTKEGFQEVRNDPTFLLNPGWKHMIFTQVVIGCDQRTLYVKVAEKK